MPPSRPARFQAFERTDGRWEWRLRAANGAVQATSHGQGFRDLPDAVRGVRDALVSMAELLGYDRRDPKLLELVTSIGIEVDPGVIDFPPA
jgi:uncharacterized protein YegP (UPF0339 family)